jgi:hypothetical protein
MIILGVPTITNNDITLFFSAITIILGIIFGSIWLILRFFNFSNFTYSEIIKITAKLSIIGVIFIWTVALIYFIIHWYNYSSTSVSNRELKGVYEIDTLYFKGKNANWQHSRYKLEISDDSLKLMVLGKNYIVKEVQRKIINIDIQDRSFFTFHDDYSTDYFIKNKRKDRYFSSKKDSLAQTEREFKIVNDSTNHHMLRVNPSLLLKPHNFRVVIYSTKFKNMYFKKVD